MFDNVIRNIKSKVESISSKMPKNFANSFNYIIKLNIFKQLNEWTLDKYYVAEHLTCMHRAIMKTGVIEIMHREW